MNSPESDYREWKRRAEQDHVLIQRLRPELDEMSEIIAFHAQQLAEKYLKTFLVYKGRKIAYTHNLLALLLDVQTYDVSLLTLEPECKFLLPHSISGRYPGIAVSRSECEAAIAAAERIRAEILKRLPDSHA